MRVTPSDFPHILYGKLTKAAVPATAFEDGFRDGKRHNAIVCNPAMVCKKLKFFRLDMAPFKAGTGNITYYRA
jgi:hypothetical protein